MATSLTLSGPDGFYGGYSQISGPFIGYSDNKNYVLRYSFTTPANGFITTLTFATKFRHYIGDIEKTFNIRVKITDSSTSHINAGNSIADYDATMTKSGTSIESKSCTISGLWLNPGTTYYLYLFPGTQHFLYYCYNNSGNDYATLTYESDFGNSSISSVEDTTLGEACNVVWTPASTNLRYKIKFSLGTWNHITDVIHPNTTNPYTYSGYVIPLDAAYQLPSATIGVMTATLYAYLDSDCTTQTGTSSSKTFNVTVPSSVVPNITSVTSTIDNSGNSVVDAWGIAIVGYTKVNVAATASGSYGSTISSYMISGGYNASQTGSELSYTGTPIFSSGTKTFIVVCTDSRGRTSAAVSSNEVVFYSYSKPLISSFTATRTSENSSKVTVNASWSYTSLDNRNSASGTLYYKKSTANNWTTYGTITQDTDTTLDILFDTTSSYNFKVIVTDELSSEAQEEVFISTLEVLLDFRAGGKGLGIGKICESDSMEVSLDTKFYGAVYINGVSLEDFIKTIIGS